MSEANTLSPQAVRGGYIKIRINFHKEMIRIFSTKCVQQLSPLRGAGRGGTKIV